MFDEGIERLLDYHGRRYWLTNGWSLRFRIWRVAPSDGRPAGIRYSFTLHDEMGARILGFDNKHPASRREILHDHRHRFRRVQEVVPYTFVDADTLLVDFFEAVAKACRGEGIALDIDFADEDGAVAGTGDDGSEDDDTQLD